MKKQLFDNGFTLIESMIAISLSLIILVAMYSLMDLMRTNQSSALTSHEITDEANRAMSFFTDSIRKAKASETGSFKIEKATGNELIYFSDYDSDGRVERIRFTKSNTIVYQATTKPSGTPVSYPIANEKINIITNSLENGTHSIFTYYGTPQSAGQTGIILSEPVTLQNIRLIKMSLHIVPSDKPTNSITLDSYGRLRVQ
jgi:prepilin-type N-terminal cleavage/methylation domain-containing protein